MTVSRQKGVAVITAILVVSLATFLSVSLSEQHAIDFRRTENILNHERAYLYLLGAEDWAIHILVRDRNDNDTDSFEDDWAQVLPAIPVENEETDSIAGNIQDLQARFNINNLLGVDDESVDYQRFKRLLANNDIPVELANAVLDWLDADSDTRFPGGAEDTEYSSLEKPYRAANRMMASTTELLRVQGFSYEYYELIEPSIIALPVNTNINLNTAPVSVLRMVVQDLNENDAKDIIESIKETPLATVDDFAELPDLQDRQFVNTGLSVDSTYFLLISTAVIGPAKSKLYSVISRVDEKNINIIMRSQGGF